MNAYHNDPAIKRAILAQLAAHRAADQLVKGLYWERGKGCAVGCTIHSANHRDYEHRFGIPCAIAHLEDRIFEGLPNDLAQQWPERLMSAVPVGANLKMVWPRFALWLFTQELAPASLLGTVRLAPIIEEAAGLYREMCAGARPKVQRWRSAIERANFAVTCEAHNFDSAFTTHVATACACGVAAYTSGAGSAAYVGLTVSAVARVAAHVSGAGEAGDAGEADAYVRMADMLIALIEEV